MAKSSTESTAVNQLIELVATQKPLPADPTEDLMFKAPSPAKRSAKVSVPRMSTAPAMRGNGEVPPLPRGRAPLGTQQNKVPPLPPPVRVSTATPSRATSIPPLPPAARPMTPSEAEVTNPGLSAVSQRDFVARATNLPTPRPSLSSTSSFEYPIVPADSAAITAPAFAPSDAADMTGHAPWFEVSSPMPRVEQTQMVARPTDYKQLVGKLIGPMLLLVVIGVFIGGYFAFDGDGGKPRTPQAAAQVPAPTEGPKVTMVATEAPTETVPAAAASVPPDRAEPAVAAPAMTPAVEPAKAEPARAEPAAITPAKAEPAQAEPAAITPPNLAATPAFVDVRIESTPAGATVVLVDRGKTTFLGTTPMSASLDPSRKYELVFTAERRATTVEALDPSKQTRVDVALARERKRTVAKAPVAAATARPAALVEPAFDAALEQTVTPATPAKPTGEGVLMISSKPPCEILIDGKPTGLVTPQRSIALPAGTHKVTLVNASEGIKKTVGVRITADKPTKLIQDFMK